MWLQTVKVNSDYNIDMLLDVIVVIGQVTLAIVIASGACWSKGIGDLKGDSCISTNCLEIYHLHHLLHFGKKKNIT